MAKLIFFDLSIEDSTNVSSPLKTDVLHEHKYLRAHSFLISACLNLEAHYPPRCHSPPGTPHVLTLSAAWHAASRMSHLLTHTQPTCFTPSQVSRPSQDVTRFLRRLGWCLQKSDRMLELRLTSWRSYVETLEHCNIIISYKLHVSPVQVFALT